MEFHIKEEDGHQEETYWELVNYMFKKEFVWLVPNDENRAEDGLELRTEFCYSRHIPVDTLSYLGPCSFLEVLIGLSRRLSFIATGSSRKWAWELLTNLKLHKMLDPLSRHKIHKIDDILDTVIWRTYSPDGQGGFFPLAWSDEDQTRVELWYQMAAYVDEMHPEH